MMPSVRAACLVACFSVANAVIVSPKREKSESVAFMASTAETAAYDCHAACGEGVDSSCVPYCQTELYMCQDHDRSVTEGAEKFDKCAEGVMAKFEKFRSEWDKNKLYFLAHKDSTTLVTLAQRADMESECKGACGEGVDSSCVPSCEVELFWCFDYDRLLEEGKEKFDKCKAKVLEDYQGFGARWEKEHPR
mmetsp:Transcript_692/g.1409  ORF Transcript_692/g.1409 Transcript_692/m.1409 type:complete len:192 (+) Transcript_692:43-618(+)|eukprot:CAMPEP_0178448522 /NCGR_PEP_ID=MMETSP0689_2-20121128/42035_1 /TAXON_ID=160604 /ORGANISM="Amphidinium massartii, Strain CS-259" /LENGTH=191 /DNA_ID=CAMNT_0020073725 /DNA_START=47 /DNA_END=622 /DNA_ORIENTATION=+